MCWLKAEVSLSVCLYNTYQDFEYIDLVDKSCIIFQLFLLNSLNRIFLVTLAMLRQIHYPKTSICKLLLKRIDFFDVAFGGVDEVLGLGAGG